MSILDDLKSITEELCFYAKKIDENTLEQVSKQILEANRIFVAGSGRSGFVGRAFANRLMHLGLSIYLVGETTTPSIRENDVLFIISGSGNTASHVSNATLAKSEGAKIITITIFPNNKIGKIADLTIVLPGVTDKVSDLKDQAVSKQPAGNMFEQLSWLTCDALAMGLQEKLNQTQDQMHYRHANME